MGKLFISIFLVFIFSISSAIAAKTFTQDCGSDQSLRVVGDKVQTKDKKSDFKWEDAVGMYLVTWNSNDIVIGYDKPREIAGTFYNRFRISTKKGSYKISALFWHSATDEEREFSFGFCENY